jgi:hypothetical protein
MLEKERENGIASRGRVGVLVSALILHLGCTESPSITRMRGEGGCLVEERVR